MADDAPQASLVFEPIKQVLKVFRHLGRHCVEEFGTVQRQEKNVIARERYLDFIRVRWRLKGRHADEGDC